MSVLDSISMAGYGFAYVFDRWANLKKVNEKIRMKKNREIMQEGINRMRALNELNAIPTQAVRAFEHLTDEK